MTALRDVTTGQPLDVLYSSPVVGKDIRWIITKSPLGNFSVWRIAGDDVPAIDQSGLKSFSRAKEVVEDKVVLYRAWSGWKK